MLFAPATLLGSNSDFHIESVALPACPLPAGTLITCCAMNLSLALRSLYSALNSVTIVWKTMDDNMKNSYIDCSFNSTHE